MKDCCQPDGPKGKFSRFLHTLTTTVIVLLVGAGIVLVLMQWVRG
ncbi:hypothetical protein LEM8419_03464 [Neolewinella maritima]|uniref:Uncharacterized protein n=1 Tax=Neolewinella maritima TaxID=1383882 RepID=A0ABN8F6L2_9BACT|nr:hypothetical protein LEM8419_03464 [Neolewinella maritima]